MTELIAIAEPAGIRRLNVVFVHGTGGDAYGTWAYGEIPATLWCRWLAEDIPGLGVFTLSYAAPPTNWLGTSVALEDLGVNILGRLMLDPALAGSPMVFVCHSLGGLVVKQLLREVSDRESRGSDEARACRSDDWRDSVKVGLQATEKVDLRRLDADYALYEMPQRGIRRNR